MSATRTPHTSPTSPTSQPANTPAKQRVRSNTKTDAPASIPAPAATVAAEAPAAPRVKRARASTAAAAASGRHAVGATADGTLRQRLTALSAHVLLAAPDGQLRAPTDDAIGAVLDQAMGTPLSPAKRALLLASLHGFDAQAEALRLTPTQLAAFMPTTSSDPQKNRADEQEGALTVAQLDALLPSAWRDAARWLLEQEGYAVEPLGAVDETTTRWRCEPQRSDANGTRQETGTVIASVVRLPIGWPLDVGAIELAATAATDVGASGATQTLLLTSAEATVDALIAARRLGVRLLDRSALRERLRAYSTAFQREQLQANEEITTRANAAIQSHAQLLAALATLQPPLALLTPDAQNVGAHGKVSGRTAVKKMVAQVSEARRMAQQALMAWETLMGEWGGAFGERPARDGGLLLTAAPTAYTALGERSSHLAEALAAALTRLATTAPDGELGYGVWRQAVAEEVIARGEALRWRVSALNPTHWRDFSIAHDDAAAQEVSRATNAAAHAATRAEKAWAQLAERGVV
ncbi:MAG: hypothetical protein ABI068_12065 [Ktedonobacterales bacterium]